MNEIVLQNSYPPSLFRVLLPILVFLVLLFFLSFFLFFIFIQIFVKSKKRQRRKAFQKTYGIKKLPTPCEVYLRKKVKDAYPSLEYYSLSYPRWKYATVNGTRDQRYKQNWIQYGTCKLYIGEFMISSPNPLQLVSLVNTLRNHGYQIEMNLLEQKKYQAAIDQHMIQDNIYSVQSIVRSFENRPTDFENFCANIFTCMGYQTHVTSRTNDGGFDIAMSQNGISYIVECKCFTPANPVGRPLLQKLVGANMTQHADIMTFVTTSYFSAPAIEYAQQFGIWLIDGNQLLELYQLYATRQVSSYTPSQDEWALTREDILRRYPPDYRFNA